MDHKQYEDYVESVVRTLSICKDATVYRNRRFPGVRQPGHYEIDIACEIKIDEVLQILIIVECKNWKRPVDREEIQKLIQTRDAINAHKAAFASASGYTKEAIDVAKANGVASWIVGRGVFYATGAGGLVANIVGETVAGALARYVSDLTGYAGAYLYPPLLYPRLIPFNWLCDKEADLLDEPLSLSSAGHLIGQDPVTAILTEHIFQHLNCESSIASKVAQRISQYRNILISSGMNPSMAQKYLEAIMAYAVAQENFFGSFNNLEVFDHQLNHGNAKLIAAIEWLTDNGKDYLIYTEPDVAPFVQLKNNIVWANVVWLMNSNGLL